MSCQFTASLLHIGARGLVLLPQEISEQLPSRGQVAVQACMDGFAFGAVVEPDGNKGHWMSVPGQVESAGQDVEAPHGELARAAKREIAVKLEIASHWPEPLVPSDLQAALAAAPDILQIWHAITPMARWEWVRWINETKNQATRARRLEVTISKMRAGKRRPCCFNLAACTDPEVSKSGKLSKPN